jgi:PAS domain S-box-containing protein
VRVADSGDYQRDDVLREINQSLLQSPDLETFLEESLDRIMLVGAFDVGAIGLIEPGTGRLKPMVSRGYTSLENLMRGRARESSAEGVSKLPSLAQRQPLCIENLAAVEGFRSFKREGLHSVIVVPIFGSDVAMGVFWLGTRSPRSFPDKEVRLLDAYASQVGLAVQRSRLHEAIQQSNVELAAQRERMETIIDNVPGIVWEGWWESDDGGRREPFVSGYVESMLGYTAEELVATPGFWLSIIHPDDRKQVVQQATFDLASGTSSAQELRYVATDGRVVWTETRCRIIEDGEGRPIGIRGVTMDISDRKRTEQALKESEERLRESQKMEAVGVLAGGIAHDFNNLLTVMNGFSELLVAQPEHPARATYMQEILKAGQRAAGLTAQLLAFSRRQVMRPQALDLNTVVADMETLVGRILGEDVAIETRLAPALPSVHADPSQISQAMLNLAANARDAMPTGGHLIIETAEVMLDESYTGRHGLPRTGPHVMLAVSDTGTGMDAETQVRAFEPFFTTKPKGKGTGLGLAMVYGIVKQSGGDVWIYSEVGVGTSVKIYLPVYEEAAPAAPPDVAPAALSWGTETVLVVEDEPGVRVLATTALMTQGYTVLEAAQGSEALEIAANHVGEIDLVITDLVMPGMSGRQLAGHLSTLRPSTRILYMSGYTDDAAVRHGLVGPSFAYLQKPFSLAGLAAKVREVLDAPPLAP